MALGAWWELLPVCKPGRPANNELWCMFQQVVRAEKILLSDSNNNELLFINLVIVQAGRNTIFLLAASDKMLGARLRNHDPK